MKPSLSLRQILNMNVGFFGIQYSFGLQQSNMSPIYQYLGANEADLPLLWLAGPMTGLLVQPIIGAMSDRTVSRYGRRTPYFLIGAIICSLSLLAMPYSSALWMAASILWILDAANNVTMEPYRAFVSDKLNKDQHAVGFLTQSAFTGLAQTLAYLTPSLLLYFGMSRDASTASHIPMTTLVAFLMGAFISTASIVWSLYTTREIPLTAAEIADIKSKPTGVIATLREVWQAILEMPITMRRLVVMKFFQWYALACYWQFVVACLARSMFGAVDASAPGFREADLLNGQIGAFYNFIAFAAAFALIPIVKKTGAKTMHCICLALAGCGMLAIPEIRDKAFLFIPMIGMGLAWASVMGNPYIMLAGSIPKERVGVYMGIFNMFIVIPMLIQSFTLPFIYKSFLNSDPQNVIRMAGVMMLCAAIATLFVKIDAEPAKQ